MAPAQKVFVVFGQTGEYSDRIDWAVRGFFSRQKAEAFEFACTQAAKKWFDARAVDDPLFCDDEALRSAVPGDPEFRCDYTGTDYYMIEVEVEP